MPSRTSGRIQGDDLIAEVLRNMEEGLFHIRRKTIVPAIYRLYLNPADYEPFRDIVPFIAGEIRTALDERLKSWNGSKRRLASSVMEKIGLGESATLQSEFVRAADLWTVEIFPDLDGKLKPGEIEVYSDLGAPQKPEYGGGSLTRRIFPKPADAAPANDPQQFESAPNEKISSSPITVSSPPEADGTKSPALAYISYVDQHGPQKFEVTKSQIVIGRGGRSYWVDLKLETVPDVSREHCRIRRDNDTGRFTIEDMSQFGTAVNGTPVVREQAAEIPRRATISLAGVIDLAWETA